MERTAAHRHVVARRRLGYLLAAAALGIAAAAAVASGAVGRGAAGPGPPPRVFAFVSRAGGAELTHLRLYGPRISVVAPNWYALNVVDQTLSGAPSPAVVELVRAAGAQLWPVVNARLGRGNAIDNPTVRGRIAGVIAAVASAHDYDGMTLDIEDLAAGQSRAFTALVAAVAGALHAQHQRLAVYAPRRTASGGDRAYDWPALARDADLLIASGYDEHSASTGPGPVSTLAGFDDMLDYAASLTQSRVAPAVGTLGYSWPVGGGPGIMLSSIQAARLGRLTGVRVRTDGGDSSFRAGGRIVYYQDASQLIAEAHAARASGVRWLAVFSLGREPGTFWAHIRTARQPPIRPHRH